MEIERVMPVLGRLDKRSQGHLSLDHQLETATAWEIGSHQMHSDRQHPANRRNAHTPKMRTFLVFEKPLELCKDGPPCLGACVVVKVFWAGKARRRGGGEEKKGGGVVSTSNGGRRGAGDPGFRRRPRPNPALHWPSECVATRQIHPPTTTITENTQAPSATMATITDNTDVSRSAAPSLRIGSRTRIRSAASIRERKPGVRYTTSVIAST